MINTIDVIYAIVAIYVIYMIYVIPTVIYLLICESSFCTGVITYKWRILLNSFEVNPLKSMT